MRKTVEMGALREGDVRGRLHAEEVTKKEIVAMKVLLLPLRYSRA